MSIILRDARVIDGCGDVRERGYVTVERNLIAEVGTGPGPGKINGHEVIDMEGRCVLPGMID